MSDAAGRRIGEREGIDRRPARAREQHLAGQGQRCRLRSGGEAGFDLLDHLRLRFFKRQLGALSRHRDGGEVAGLERDFRQIGSEIGVRGVFRRRGRRSSA